MIIENNRFGSRQEAHNHLRTLGVPERKRHDTAVVYDCVSLGERVAIGAYSVIGSEGFGFDPESNYTKRWRHVGNVAIEDDVEIGGGCHIDRAVLGTTFIGRNTKIDNLVHIAHNCVIGERCILTAKATLGGSVRLGNDVFVGLNATIKDHVRVGNNAVIGCGANVIRDVPGGMTVVGNPARDINT